MAIGAVAIYRSPHTYSGIITREPDMADTRTKPLSCDLAVVGGGPAGLATALLAARAGLKTVLAAPQARPDHRTFALMAGAVRMLQRLDAWEPLLPRSAPLRWGIYTLLTLVIILYMDVQTTHEFIYFQF